MCKTLSHICILYLIMEIRMEDFEQFLLKENLSRKTITSYLYTINKYFDQYEMLTKKDLLAFKGELIEDFSPKTVNIRLQGINKYLEYRKRQDLRLKMVRIQQKNFLENVISDADYKFLKKFFC